MKLLVIGSGGREHAIAKKLLMDKAVTKVYCAKGNPGMIADGIEIVAIEEENHQALIQFAKEEQIDWTFVGPEVPLLNGIVDDFQAEGLKIFGPNRAAAMIEGSKEFAKELMVANYIPTAEYRSFEDFELAKQYVLAKGAPIVIKADGLAAGKGVVVAETEAIAIAALKDMLEENRFGESGAKVVIEEFLAGEEFSLLAFVKDENVYPMVIAQDHKRAFDGDKGPNTGGMGAYSPVPQIPETMVKQAVSQVLRPAAQGMVSRGTPFTGILYAGLIATADGPKVIEFNARFGDPETQVVLPRLESSLAEIITALLVNEEPEIRWNARATLGVVVAAEGYPNEYKKDVVLPIIENDEVNVYYAGVKQEEVLVSSGGRVFLVQSEGETIKEAQEKVYRTLAEHSLEELFYRTDIGDKAFKK
ncbi:phosphoribosylamine--glycine ligase [Enterococcus saccharolyticus]|uniref:phosphoribosylamine--glycine ligase n=1 Tax=Enterococcus saccharolyticus TaxID=41997 RepID=UPI001E485998|nr:phosphoribosylamine--glycine ligase [Enterococcus saccharolyticus]MCD5002456.1 phosphoribosylamine--glycine ligase [Enterococcus saccharolyticus]